MKVLLLCHIEDMFAGWFPTGYRYHLVRELVTGEWDKVFALVSHVQDEEPIEEIIEHGYEEITWGWGYEPTECYDGDCDACGERHYGDDVICPWIVTEGVGHEASWVPPELREDDCKSWDIYIGGGYDTECLQDLRGVLDHQGLNYTELNHIIY